MPLQIYIILIATILTIVIIVFSLFYRRKAKEYAQKLSEQKNYYDECLNHQQNEYENRLHVQHTEAENYRNQVYNNLRKKIPSAEIILTNLFKGLFENQSFKDFIIYNHLEFNFNGRLNQVDFFVVSPKGFFVIESKCWKGVTYFYSKDYPDIFSKTEFDSFGVGSGLDIQAFNVQEHNEEKGKLLISAYENPVAQARKYSGALTSILPINNGMGIKNVVVFNKLDKFAVFYDDKPLKIQKLDSFSCIISDTDIKNYFDSFSDNHCDTQKVVEYIDHNLGYLFKMDDKNYNQAPFDLI